MWFRDAVFYQIYPLGLCGAPPENDGHETPRINALCGWIPHLRELGVDAAYLCPVFESDRHGYDTRDYTRLDKRLGTNADLRAVCGAFHDAGIRIVLDGVFNHVGRGFWAFRDVREKKQASPYADWFHIDWNRDGGRGDGFWYEGWEGHFELVKLNLHNPAVVDYLLDCVEGWMTGLGIDGLRLDVAYMLDEGFLRRLHAFTKSRRPDFFLLGETIHGDYNRLLGDGLLDSCTNYECYKGLYSSLNEKNLFEIAYSLNRQFGPEPWTLYKERYLFNFVDNHDVSRIASRLNDPRLLPVIYGMLYTIPGIPCVYYGSEWGLEGVKGGPGGDGALRPAVEAPRKTELTALLARLARVRGEHPALRRGDYRQIHLTNTQLAYRREIGGDAAVVAVNAGTEPYKLPVEAGCRPALSTGEAAGSVSGAPLSEVTVPPFGFVILTT